MPVSFEELVGSPRIVINRQGGNITRMFKIAAADRDAFLSEVFPHPTSGYTSLSIVAGYGWLLASQATVEPFGDEEAKATGAGPTEVPPAYTTLKVTVEYTPPEEDGGMESNPGGGRSPVNTGPGGDKGSTGGATATLVTHRISVGAESFSIGGKGLVWEQFVDGGELHDAIDLPGFPEDPSIMVKSAVGPGLLIPHIDHHITLHKVIRPKWSNIRAAVGKVNNAPIFGGAAECVLFLGVEAEVEYGTSTTESTQYIPYWRLEFKFSEKNVGDAAIPKGWNHFWNPGASTFIRVLKVAPDGQSYSYTYGSADLGSIF